jgi:hypothetical protein
VTAAQSGQVIAIKPIPNSVVDDIAIRDCVFRGATAPPDIRGGDVRLSGVTIERAK